MEVRRLVRAKETTAVHILLRTGFIFFIGISIAFVIIYFFTKREFEERTENEISSVTEIVKESITSTQESTETLERLVDLRLYTISQAIAEELEGKRIEEVSQEQLELLKTSWGLSELCLLTRQGDDIVIAKSTEEKEVDLQAKGWGYWYTAISDLFDRRAVSVAKGYAAENYWVGPLSLSEVVDKHYKYAFYFDGTTDFMIDAYIEADDIYSLIQTKGTTQLIHNIKRGYQNVDEIAVINASAYLKGDKNKVIEPMTDLPVLYGLNTTRLEADQTIFQQALTNSVFEIVKFEKNGRQMEKIYISLPEQRILTVVMNKDEQQRILKNMLLIFISIFCITITSLFIFFQMATKKTSRLLRADRERLMIAEDFKRTIEILPSAIYKCRREHDQQYILTYSEGPLMEELGLTIERVKECTIEEILQHSWYQNIYPMLELAYQEGRAEHTWEYKGRTYQHVLQAIYDVDYPYVVKELAGYAADITERKKADDKIHYLALHDTLTALPNRMYFHEKLEVALSEEAPSKVAVIFVDLDNFKQVNDTLGHEAGDMLLVEVAERLTKCIGQNAFLSRMGGDEFTILLTHYDGKLEVEQLCQKIVQQLQQPFYIMKQELFVTMSVGASVAPDDGTTSKILLKNADIAMYSAKQNGKNSYQFYTADMELYHIRRMEIQQDLRQALQTSEHLFLLYQPQMDLETKRIVGVEALLRWHHPIKGFISPTEFIPIAEESGLIEELGDWILREACKQFAGWREEGLAPIRVSVNLSPRQFRQQNLVGKISSILQETEMYPQYLHLEITEGASMENIAHTIQVIQQLRDISVGISIDDFGIGYSSLNYLKDFSINHLKIDQSFVRELDLNSPGKAIVKSIIDLALNLNLKVIAEGVETKEELDILVQMGCHEVQGYYLSRPVLPERIKVIMNQYVAAS